MVATSKPYSAFALHSALLIATGLCLWVITSAKDIGVINLFMTPDDYIAPLGWTLIVIWDYVFKVASVVTLIAIMVTLSTSALMETAPDIFNTSDTKPLFRSRLSAELNPLFIMMREAAIHAPSLEKNKDRVHSKASLLVTVIQIPAFAVLFVSPIPLGTMTLLGNIHHLLLGGTVENSISAMYTSPLGVFISILLSVFVYLILFLAIKGDSNGTKSYADHALGQVVNDEKQIKVLRESKTVILIKGLSVLLSVTILVLSLI